MQYLNEPQYYTDRYDLFTIKQCLSIVETYQEVYRESLKDKEFKDIPKEEKSRSIGLILGRKLYAVKADEFKEKAKTIEEWMEKDRIKQEKYDTTKPPPNIRCLICNEKMHSEFKTLEDFTDEPLRVLFFFECPKCNKRRGIFENGEERLVKPHLCSKCNTEVKREVVKEKDILTTTTICPSCGFTETETDNFKEQEKKWKKEKDEDKKLLEKYRDEFCLSDEDGKEYLETIEAMELADHVFKQEKRKYYDPAYEELSNLKRLSVVDVEKLLKTRLESLRYCNLIFEKPEINQFVIVPFTLQDEDSSRKKALSENDAKKIIVDILQNTNWRLVGDLSYRLGYLSGKLKGYERDEDLLQLLGRQHKESKLDPEKEKKYGYHSIVQLAKLTGKFEGEEEVRKLRLKKEPEGFLLGTGEGYSCQVCDSTNDGNQTWWDENCIRCLDCQRNFKEGVFPIEVLTDEESWIREWELKDSYGISATTVKKLMKQGMLHARDLKAKDGAVYCSIFLKKENKKFLKKYPKVKEAIEPQFIEKNGQKIMS